MSEIEKLMQNAGVEKDWKKLPYGDIEEYYSEFTVEKQLNLIEWFISYRWWLNLKSLDKKIDFSLDFDEKLAKLVNRLWESFNDQEKVEIKEILK